jgi:prepilin-type N-terminal cleavage/methylation domain-containing protein
VEPARDKARSEAGMTLVELLVVMLIVGALAAIAIPTFFSQSDKARDTAAKSAARTAAGAIEVYSTGHDGSYMGATPIALHNIETTLDPAALTVSGWDGSGIPDDRSYRVTVLSPTGNDFWIARSATATMTLGCQAVGRAGCPLDGRWG